MDKTTLRKAISAQKRAMTQAQIQEASAFLAAQLFAHPLYKQARAIYGYLSYNQEVQTVPILRRAMADGKRVALPKIFCEEMRFIWMDDLWRVREGYKGVPEPMDDAPIADDDAALVLLPGLAFDAKGGRLGYGGGFYDRFLANRAHPTIALCYDFQLLQDIPREPHDICIDALLVAPHCTDV
ncbi:MAG: 5-formyltetrahydrofolate cyclo-ligase [Oscillospiraceae bacterium]|jgi:5-formyltetrahydrofolate cyclo-ligase|nr:5-formyltetrahydrofolate cyclo-ligase [Oscillospiraceae bacterium]